MVKTKRNTNLSCLIRDKIERLEKDCTYDELLEIKSKVSEIWRKYNKLEDIKTLNSKTTKEAIESLQQFLECDLYSKFRPEQEVNGKTFERVDPFKDKNDFHKYIEKHFGFLLKQVEELEK